MKNIILNDVKYTPVIKQKNYILEIPAINLEIYQKDFFELMNWDDAEKACKDLGAGWRLPTKEELNLMYQNKAKIGGFADYYYWSSSENNNSYAWKQNFNNGKQFSTNKDDGSSVRAVKNIK